MSKLDDPSAVVVLKEAAARDLNAELRVHLARAILDLRDPAGFGMLVKALDADPPKFVRAEGLAVGGRAQRSET